MNEHPGDGLLGGWKTGTSGLLAVSPALHLPTRGPDQELPGRREDPAEGRDDMGLGALLHPQVWKWSWPESRLSSKSEAKAPTRQPYPLTEYGNVPA